jgi:hypothetical protein
VAQQQQGKSGCRRTFTVQMVSSPPGLGFGALTRGGRASGSAVRRTSEMAPRARANHKRGRKCTIKRGDRHGAVWVPLRPQAEAVHGSPMVTTSIVEFLKGAIDTGYTNSLATHQSRAQAHVAIPTQADPAYRCARFGGAAFRGLVGGKRRPARLRGERLCWASSADGSWFDTDVRYYGSAWFAAGSKRE